VSTAAGGDATVSTGSGPTELDASGGTATTGGAAALAFTWTAQSGTATAAGGLVIHGGPAPRTYATTGGTFNDNNTGGVPAAAGRGGEVWTYKRGGTPTSPTRGGITVEPSRGGVLDETTTGGTVL
jgi:hypothetical protein